MDIWYLVSHLGKIEFSLGVASQDLDFPVSSAACDHVWVNCVKQILAELLMELLKLSLVVERKRWEDHKVFW